MFCDLFAKFLDYRSRLYAKKINVSTKTIPADTYNMAFLKVIELTGNIQKEENTKKITDKPKKIFKKNKGSLERALCRLVIFLMNQGSSLVVYWATPVPTLYVPFSK